MTRTRGTWAEVFVPPTTTVASRSSPSARGLALLAAIVFVAAPGASRAQLLPPNHAGVTWGHIHLNVTDAERHTGIWVEHFGGTVVDEAPVPTVRLPGTVIMMNERAPTGGTQGSALDHFGFSVPNLAAFLEGWRADGLEVAAEFEGFDGRPQAYVTAPDDIRVELQEVPDLSVPAEPYHVHVYTGDGDETLRDWYAEIFSMAPRARGSIPHTADVPGMNVSFSGADEEPAATRGRAVDHIGFEIDGLKAFTERLEARGIELVAPYRELEGLGIAVAFFVDPAGVFVELTEGLDRY